MKINVPAKNSTTIHSYQMTKLGKVYRLHVSGVDMKLDGASFYIRGEACMVCLKTGVVRTKQELDRFSFIEVDAEVFIKGDVFK